MSWLSVLLALPILLTLTFLLAAADIVIWQKYLIQTFCSIALVVGILPRTKGACIGARWHHLQNKIRY